MNFLFVAGCQRSGTTAFADYLNCHDEILLTRERYKFLEPAEITPSLFSFERILDYTRRETTAPQSYHERLLASKDPGSLRWIGDKRPAYVDHLPTLARNLPGVRFIVLYRPLDEVAESFEFKAKDPRSHWKRRKGFERGIESWNHAQHRVREFTQTHPHVPLLVIDYQDFFGDAETSVSLLSAFLEVDFPDTVREEWRRRSEQFRRRRRQKQPLTWRQARLIRKRKDREADEWVRSHIATQRRALGERVAQPSA